MLSHVSADGDQGFPGEVAVNVTIRLTDDNEIELNFTAKVKGKATPINLTTHPYFNLAGHVCFQSQMSLYDFYIEIFACFLYLISSEFFLLLVGSQYT